MVPQKGMDMRNSERLEGDKIGYLLVFAGGAMWGLIGTFVTWMGQCGSSTDFTSFIRTTFACLIMIGFTAYKYGFRALLIDKKTLFGCALMGIICQGFNCLVYNYAIVTAGVAISAILLNVSPAFTAIISFFLFSEKITTNKKMAMVVNIIGCALAVTGGSIANSNVSWLGVLYGLASGLTYALMPIIGRILGTKCNVYVMNVYNYLFATLFIGFFTKIWNFFPSVTPKMLGVGFLYGLIPTAIAYLLYYMGVQKIKETSKVPVIASVETVVSVSCGVLICGESLGIVNIMGIALVLSSIVLMNYVKKEKMHVGN